MGKNIAATLGVTLGTALGVFLAVLIVRQVTPDIRRYMRMRSM